MTVAGGDTLVCGVHLWLRWDGGSDLLWTVTVPRNRKLHLLTVAGRFWCRLYGSLLHCARGRLVDSRPADVLDVGLTLDVYSSLAT